MSVPSVNMLRPLLLAAILFNVVAATSFYDPCRPSPCGPNSVCSTVNNHGVCSCQPEHDGSPPNCRAKSCDQNSDCGDDKACINLTCRDPCPGSCGLNAVCKVDGHRSTCSCPAGLTGDPFRQCLHIPVPATKSS